MKKHILLSLLAALLMHQVYAQANAGQGPTVYSNSEIVEANHPLNSWEGQWTVLYGNCSMINKKDKLNYV